MPTKSLAQYGLRINNRIAAIGSLKTHPPSLSHSWPSYIHCQWFRTRRAAEPIYILSKPQFGPITTHGTQKPIKEKWRRVL